MDALVRVGLPVGLHRSTVRPAEHTLVLKTTYVLTHGSVAQFAPMQEGLREAQREGGRLIYPTDFSESKAACDVVFVGPVLLGEGPVTLRVGSFQRTASSPRVFGPAVQLDRQWAASCAPADGRMPFPSLPLTIEMAGAAFRMSSAIPAPAPLAALVVRDKWSHMIGVALRVDTILIDPMRSSVEVISRGTFSYSGDVHQDVVAVVDAAAALAVTPPEEMRAWSRLRVVDASFRRPAPTERGHGGGDGAIARHGGGDGAIARHGGGDGAREGGGTAPIRKPAATQRLSAPTRPAPEAPEPRRAPQAPPPPAPPPPPRRPPPPPARPSAPQAPMRQGTGSSPPRPLPSPVLGPSARVVTAAPTTSAAGFDDPMSDDAPTFDGDESTFVLGDESLEEVIDSALAKAAPVPHETMTIDVGEDDLVEPPTIPPPAPSGPSSEAMTPAQRPHHDVHALYGFGAPATPRLDVPGLPPMDLDAPPRLDTVTLDVPLAAAVAAAQATPWSPVFNQPPDFKTGLLPIPADLVAPAPAARAPDMAPPWMGGAPAVSPPIGAPPTTATNGLPPLPSLSSLVVARNPAATLEAPRPAFAKADAAAEGPSWLARKPASASPLSTQGTPFRAYGADRAPDLPQVQPVSPLGMDQTAADLPSAFLALPSTEPALREPPRLAPIVPVEAPSALAGLGMSLQRGAAPAAPLVEPPPPIQPMSGMARLQPVPEVAPALVAPGLAAPGLVAPGLAAPGPIAPAPVSPVSVSSPVVVPPPPSSSGLVVPPPPAPALAVPPAPASVRGEAPPSRPAPSSRDSSPRIPRGDRSYSGIHKPDLMTPSEVERKVRVRPPPGPGPKIEGLTVEEYAFIRAALWADEVHRKEILKENGLTELKWKVIDRRWSKHIESLAEKPAELATLLEVLQRATVDVDRPV